MAETLQGERADAKLELDRHRARREKVKADEAEGRVIRIEEAREQIQALALAVRQQLDRANSYLPSDLKPEDRAVCERALREAIVGAMAALGAAGKN